MTFTRQIAKRTSNRIWMQILGFGMLVLASGLGPGSVSAQESVASPASQALGDSVWYDPENGVVPIHVTPRVDDSLNRHSRWLPKAARVKKRPTPPAANTGAGTGLLGTDLTFANIFGWMLLALLVVALVGLLVYAFSKAEIEFGSSSSASSKAANQVVDKQTIERMKHLPPELRRAGVNMRSEAERLMQEGQYDQAIILLFGHQLLMLDKAGMLRLTRGKTNGRYVRETRSADVESGKRLRATATAFERSYFGRHQVNVDEFRFLWQNNLELEQRVDAQREAA